MRAIACVCVHLVCIWICLDLWHVSCIHKTEQRIYVFKFEIKLSVVLVVIKMCALVNTRYHRGYKEKSIKKNCWFVLLRWLRLSASSISLMVEYLNCGQKYVCVCVIPQRSDRYCGNNRYWDTELDRISDYAGEQVSLKACLKMWILWPPITMDLFTFRITIHGLLQLYPHKNTHTHVVYQCTLPFQLDDGDKMHNTRWKMLDAIALNEENMQKWRDSQHTQSMWALRTSP